jgi:hypothetical protein
MLILAWSTRYATPNTERRPDLVHSLHSEGLKWLRTCKIRSGGVSIPVCAAGTNRKTERQNTSATMAIELATIPSPIPMFRRRR